MVARLLSKIRGRRTAELPVDDCLSQPQFRHLLERERARTDRSGNPFVVVSFSPRSGSDLAAWLEELRRVFHMRIRITDVPGWLDDRRLALLLPDTPAAGGWKVADDLIALFSPDIEPPYCEVYSYPGHDDDSSLESNADNEQPTPSRPAQPMHVLWTQALPAWKRAMDVLGAVLGLTLALPVLAGCAAAIKWTSPGPVMFRQARRGLGGRPFVMYKLRTMQIDAEQRRAELLEKNEQDGPAFKIKYDPRTTPIGRFLRNTSIDELPQLINVLKGEMSLVGPRPLPCEESDGCQQWQKRRLDVTPGLTCIWQVHGRSAVPFVEWMRMDLRYVSARTFWQDSRLIVKTALAVLLRKNLR